MGRAGFRIQDSGQVWSHAAEKPVNVVVGKPIIIDKVENPTNKEIDDLHAGYVIELKTLYKKCNPKYGDSLVKLVIS